MIISFLFPSKPISKGASALLLVSRVIFGLLFMTHGLQKWSNWSELSSTFPDPLGIGSSLSLGLAIFGELACSVAIIFGVLTRLALIPMIFTMIIAFFIIHANDPLAVKELALVYMAIFTLLFIAGPGKFSIDWLLGQEINKRKNKRR